MSKASMLGTTLVALSASAFAVPEVRVEHRALQASCWSGAFTEERCCDGPDGDSSCWGGEFTFSHCCGAKPAGRGRGSSALDQSASDTGFAAALAAAVTTDADGQHHLYFHATDAPTPTFLRCGEVDAAPYMPASLFEPANALALAAYAEVTIRAYVNPNPLAEGPLALGRCSSIGYNQPGGGVQGISWFGRGSGLMGPVCAERCNCNFRGDGPSGLPACRDAADDPTRGEFCSLCGPSTACPGCTAGTVVISLFYPGGPPPPAPTPPTPAPPPAHVLYTCQNSQCVVSDQGLGMADCEAICTPASPAPHAGNELYFRFVNQLDGGDRCGEVDAAPRMPVALFEPSNKPMLDAYIALTIDNYRPLGRDGGAFLDGPSNRLELGRCADVGYTTYSGDSANADWTGRGRVTNDVMETICQVQCNCRYHLGQCHGYADDSVRNGAVAGNYCSLCNWAPPSNSARPQVPFYNGEAQVFFFVRPFGGAH